MPFCMYILFIMNHICILLYIHVTVPYYILASFQKIKNVLLLCYVNLAIYQNNKKTSLEKKKVESVEPVFKNIYQSNTYIEDLGWPHFDDEPKVQDKQQVKEQQSCIFVFVTCLTIPSSN